MKIIKKLKDFFIKQQVSANQKEYNLLKKDIRTLTNLNSKSIESNNLTTQRKNKKQKFSYESFSDIELYKKPIINNQIEREKLHNQISKELEELKN